jgi:2'-5' RNA ligase
MRLFVAVEIDPSVTRALADFSATLRRTAHDLAPAARIGWVRPEQLHVTSRFIGEVDDEKAAAIAGALLQELAVPPFDLVVQGAGAFPERGAPRVLWAGIAAGDEGLAAVETEVSTRLAACGISREDRPYRPHVTLARVREPAGLRSAALFERLADQRFGTSHVEAITLFQSRTSPKGAVYTPLHRTPLARRTMERSHQGS